MFHKLKNRPEKNYFHRPQKNANLTGWQSGRTAQKNGAYTGPAERRRAKVHRQTAKTERGGDRTKAATADVAPANMVKCLGSTSRLYRVVWEADG